MNEQRHTLDKQLTVRQIVEEEKKIMEDRFKEDIERLQKASVTQMKGLEHPLARRDKAGSQSLHPRHQP